LFLKKLKIESYLNYERQAEGMRKCMEMNERPQGALNQ